jgi:hypothetical protein
MLMCYSQSEENQPCTGQRRKYESVEHPHQTPQEVSMHLQLDSWTVTMEVEVRLEVYNNSPIECIGPENGLYLSMSVIPPHGH